MRTIRDAARNLRARLSRTILTVAGIAIGILALVVVGSLAERLHEIVARSTAINAGTVFAIIDTGTLERAGPAKLRGIARTLAALDGVAAVVPEVALPY